METLATGERHRRQIAGVVVEQTQRELLLIGEVNAAHLALGPREISGELARQLQQRVHVVARPLPILRQRRAIVAGQIVEEFGVVEKLFNRLAAFTFRATQPFGAVGGDDFFHSGGAVREGRAGFGQGVERGEAGGDVRAACGVSGHGFAPELRPFCDAADEILAPRGRCGVVQRGKLFRKPSLRRRQRLRVMMNLHDELADGVIAAVAVVADEVADGFGAPVSQPARCGICFRPCRAGGRRSGGVVPLEKFIEHGVKERLGLLVVEDGELRVKAERVEIPAHEFEAEAVQRGDWRGLQQRGLFGEMVRGFGV